MVKVSAELLDDLVNLAGETSIFRGRIEQQVNDAHIALNEMETTIERMRDQLRRLDTETQGRILSRQQVEAEPHRPLLVMVVDDSVTVRKVTSRLLERHGMSVLTAKDGVDAMLLLEEHMPDLMLLDIEMPRMDGFEVATQVRNDERLQHLPIIMITSRTGQKHRDRAMAIGVNDYLGKPYQESVLLESIALWSKTHA